MSVTVARVRHYNPQWFSKGNKRFFGDSWYRVRKARSGKYYLLRSTSQWSDMFGGTKKYVYKLNGLTPMLKIESLVDETFGSIEQVNAWLKQH